MLGRREARHRPRGWPGTLSHLKMQIKQRTSTMYRLKLRIRFVLSDKIAKQKTWFLLCSGGWYAV
jgi:hypothetical protein